MKIAILHEMLVKLGGAEKVVEVFLEAFPEADIFTLIYDEKKVKKIFPIHKINPQVFKLKTQKIYNLFGKQRLCLPYMSQSAEALDFSEYDVVLCSSSGFAHGAITKPETKFIVYYHSPAGYLWHQTHNYQNLILNQKNIFLRILLKYYFTKLKDFRIWDYVASKRNDIKISASYDSKKRIEKYYKNKVDFVVFPPVEVDKFKNQNYSSKDYYISIGELTESKRYDILIEKFNNLPEKKLIIIGNGSLKNKLTKSIKNKNITLVGYKSGEELVKLVGESKGAIFCGIEDFGIAAVEALASGKPIFTLAKAGYLETNLSGVTGEFYEDENGSDFIEKFKIFDKNIDSGVYKKQNLINQAEKFSKQNFVKSIKKIVENE